MSAFATRSLCRRKLCCPHCGLKPFLTSSSGSCCPLATCASYESSSAALMCVSELAVMSGACVIV
eukprot:6889927-Prymnesium_polylepis.1